MFKIIVFVSALVFASMIGCHMAMEDHRLALYLDAHPNPDTVPAIEYVAGHINYTMQDLERAATYFMRIPAQYPKSKYADRAYYYYVVSLDLMMTMGIRETLEKYESYLEKYPNGQFSDHVKMKVERLKQM